MLDLFSDIKSTILRRRSVYIDNAVFRLHWMITPSLLISFAIILTARQYGEFEVAIEDINPLNQFFLQWVSQSTVWWKRTLFPARCSTRTAGSRRPFSFRLPSVVRWALRCLIRGWTTHSVGPIKCQHQHHQLNSLVSLKQIPWCWPTVPSTRAVPSASTTRTTSGSALCSLFRRSSSTCHTTSGRGQRVDSCKRSLWVSGHGFGEKNVFVYVFLLSLTLTLQTCKWPF